MTTVDLQLPEWEAPRRVWATVEVLRKNHILVDLNLRVQYGLPSTRSLRDARIWIEGHEARSVAISEAQANGQLVRLVFQVLHEAPSAPAQDTRHQGSR